MIKTVASIDLPVDEVLEIKKRRFVRHEKGNSNKKRISIVTGTHGDELEGQYVCYLVGKRIEENKEYLNGTVDIYPALNPMGIDSITRGIPGFDLDMNRVFPGTQKGAMGEYAAYKIVHDIKGSSVCVDIHASNIFLTEIPQIRINVLHKKELVPLAKKCNVDFIWVHNAATVLESTLAYSLNSLGTPTLVAEMGVGMRITKEYCEQLTEGLFNLMKHLGIWTGPVAKVRKPIVSKDGGVQFLNAEVAGIFVPEVEHWKKVIKGEIVGNIVNPLTGYSKAVKSPCDGILFTRREYPVLDEGSLIGRILETKD